MAGLTWYDFWIVSKWLGGAYKSSSSHLDHLQNPVLIRDDRRKWLDFGITPDPETLQPHLGFVWVKSGYSETIAWRKVRLTKHCNWTSQMAVCGPCLSTQGVCQSRHANQRIHAALCSSAGNGCRGRSRGHRE